MTVEQVEIYDQNGKMLGVLDNADGIGYELKHNDLWTGSFALPTDDPKNAFCQAHNRVRLPDGSRDLGVYRIIGIPSGEMTAQAGTITYNVEHVMATLLDDILFGYHEIGGNDIHTRAVMEYILARQTVKRWKLGACDFDGQFTYKWENTSLLTALLSLGSVLTEEYTWDFDTSEGNGTPDAPWTVNLRRADQEAGCGIYYERQLKSIEKTMDASALVTRLYALGYGEGVNQLTIRDVNGGVPYLDADTASVWGIKSSVFTDTRLEDPAQLKARAQMVLEGYKNPYVTYKASAVDLFRLTGMAWDKYMPGKLVDVMDAEHGVQLRSRIVSISKGDTLGDPGQIEITIANAVRDTADSINTLAGSGRHRRAVQPRRDESGGAVFRGQRRCGASGLHEGLCAGKSGAHQSNAAKLAGVRVPRLRNRRGGWRRQSHHNVKRRRRRDHQRKQRGCDLHQRGGRRDDNFRTHARPVF